MGKKLSRRKNGLLLLVVCVIPLLIAAFYNGLTVTEYTVYSEKINKSLTIVLLADLHNCAHGPSQRTLIENIDKQTPDLIVMAGDMFDDDLSDSRMIKLLDGIANKYPCYYVTGNHEIWSGRVNKQKEILRAYGVTVLEGNGTEASVNGQALFICGVDDPAASLRAFIGQLENAAALIDPEQYTMLLSHRPDLLEHYASYDFDLVLSGHAHGGQWRVPFFLPNGLFAPNQGWFPKYTNRIYEKEGTKILVSRGLSRESTRVPRIFNRPEVVVVNLTPKTAR